jgi:hypothetical protein
MLSPRLTSCTECYELTLLLADIDRKLAQLANDLYNNITLSLNKAIPGTVMLDLLNYKRINTYSLCKKEYATGISNQIIASRGKILKLK